MRVVKHDYTWLRACVRSSPRLAAHVAKALESDQSAAEGTRRLCHAECASRSSAGAEALATRSACTTRCSTVSDTRLRVERRSTSCAPSWCPLPSPHLDAYDSPVHKDTTSHQPSRLKVIERRATIDARSPGQWVHPSPPSSMDDVRTPHRYIETGCSALRLIHEAGTPVRAGQRPLWGHAPGRARRGRAREHRACGNVTRSRPSGATATCKAVPDNGGQLEAFTGDHAVTRSAIRSKADE